MFANENYASDYQLWEDHGQNNFLGKTYYVTDGNWPEKAQNIIDDAGVPEQNQFLVSYIRAYPSIRVETDKLNCTVQFENTLGNPVNAMCMLAIYNEEGILVELEMSDVNIQPGFSQIIKKNFDLKNRQDLTNATVKLLIWEGSSIGSSSYRPLAAAKTVMLKIAN